MANDERQTVEQAREMLSTLTPTSARTDAIVRDLRYASGLMARAASKGSSSEIGSERLARRRIHRAKRRDQRIG